MKIKKLSGNFEITRVKIRHQPHQKVILTLDTLNITMSKSNAYKLAKLIRR